MKGIFRIEEVGVKRTCGCDLRDGCVIEVVTSVLRIDPVRSYTIEVLLTSASVSACAGKWVLNVNKAVIRIITYTFAL